MSVNRETGPQTNRGSHQCLTTERRVHRQPEEVINVCQQRNGSTDKQRKSSMSDNREKGPQTTRGSHQCLTTERRVHGQTEEVIYVCQVRNRFSNSQRKSSNNQMKSSMSVSTEMVLKPTRGIHQLDMI